MASLLEGRGTPHSSVRCRKICSHDFVTCDEVPLSCAVDISADRSHFTLMPHRGTKERILVAEDDGMSRDVIVQLLITVGYRVLEAADGKEALEIILREKPALALLDVEMPEMGGLEVLSRLRKRGEDLPVLVLSGRTALDDRVQGLSIGADDYLTKPFESAELLARVGALLRRHGRKPSGEAVLQIGPAKVDLGRKVATIEGAEVRLTPTECSILEVLVAERGRPVSREQMLDRVWGYTYIPATRTLDTHIWRLRKKLRDDETPPRWIKNLSGLGYQLARANPDGSAERI